MEITFTAKPSHKVLKHYYFWWSQCTWWLVCRILRTRVVLRKEGLKFQKDICNPSDAIPSSTKIAEKTCKVWLHLYQLLLEFGTDLTVLMWLFMYVVFPKKEY